MTKMMLLIMKMMLKMMFKMMMMMVIVMKIMMKRMVRITGGLFGKKRLHRKHRQRVRNWQITSIAYKTKWNS
jgi:hypothetical protein